MWRKYNNKIRVILEETGSFLGVPVNWEMEKNEKKRKETERKKKEKKTRRKVTKQNETQKN